MPAGPGVLVELRSNRAKTWHESGPWTVTRPRQGTLRAHAVATHQAKTRKVENQIPRSEHVPMRSAWSAQPDGQFVNNRSGPGQCGPHFATGTAGFRMLAQWGYEATRAF